MAYVTAGAFDYYDSALSSRMTMSRITLYALVPLFVIYILLCLVGRKKDFEIRKWKMVRQIVVLLLVVVAGVYVLLLVLNSSMQDGIRSLGEWSALVFDNQWGSARGATWSAGTDISEYSDTSQVDWCGIGLFCDLSLYDTAGSRGGY